MEENQVVASEITEDQKILEAIENDDVDSLLFLNRSYELASTVNQNYMNYMLKKRVAYVEKHQDKLAKVGAGMAADAIVQIFCSIHSKDFEKIMKLSPRDKISLARRLADIYKALAPDTSIKMQFNNVQQITEDEARRFLAREWDEG